MSIKNNDKPDYSKAIRLIMRLLSIIGFIVSFFLVYKGYQMGIFSSEEALANFLDTIGSGAPFILIFLLVFRSVTKIIPAAILLPVSVLLFGQAKGLFYNIIGSIIGATVVFSLARKFGDKLVKIVIGERRYNKYIHYLDSNGKFKTLFTIVLFLPLGPSDIFCMLAGLSNMRFKEFFIRLCIGKPVSVSIYTNLLLSTFNFLQGLKA